MKANDAVNYESRMKQFRLSEYEDMKLRLGKPDIKVETIEGWILPRRELLDWLGDMPYDQGDVNAHYYSKLRMADDSPGSLTPQNLIIRSGMNEKMVVRGIHAAVRKFFNDLKMNYYRTHWYKHIAMNPDIYRPVVRKWVLDMVLACAHNTKSLYTYAMFDQALKELPDKNNMFSSSLATSYQYNNYVRQCRDKHREVVLESAPKEHEIMLNKLKELHYKEENDLKAGLVEMNQKQLQALSDIQIHANAEIQRLKLLQKVEIDRISGCFDILKTTRQQDIEDYVESQHIELKEIQNGIKDDIDRSVLYFTGNMSTLDTFSPLKIGEKTVLQTFMDSFQNAISERDGRVNSLQDEVRVLKQKLLEDSQRDQRDPKRQRVSRSYQPQPAELIEIV